MPFSTEPDLEPNTSRHQAMTVLIQPETLPPEFNPIVDTLPGLIGSMLSAALARAGSELGVFGCPDRRGTGPPRAYK